MIRALLRLSALRARALSERLASHLRTYRKRQHDFQVTQLSVRVRITLAQLSPEERVAFLAFMREEYADNPFMLEVIELAAESAAS